MLGDDLGDVRQHLNRRVEQNGAANPLRVRCRELEDQPASERVADPVGLVDSECVERLDQVGHVGGERPGRVVARASVSAQIGCDDAEVLGPALLREPPEPLAVPGDAVQADERRRVGVPPGMHVQLHRGR